MISKIKNFIIQFYVCVHSKLKKHKCLYVNKIGVVYYIPKDSPKSDIWQDGFTKAIEIIAQEYSIEMINLAITRPTSEDLNKLDFLIVKSNWGWIPDNYIRKEIRGVKCRKALMISGINPPPKILEMLFYDVLYFETFWYYPQISQHPLTIHAFGIDTSEMIKKPEIDKSFDYITVGAFTEYKRHDLFEKKPGKKIAVGETHYKDSLEIITRLKKNNIEIKEFLSYQELCDLYNRSRKLYIGAGINGGGERAILEARACGIEVEIANNPKLHELTKSPIWNEHYYANQLLKGFKTIEKKNRNIFAYELISNKSLMVGKHSFHNGSFQIKGDEYVEIGSYCAIGENVRIITSNHDYNFCSIQGFFYKKYFGEEHPGARLSIPNKERTKGGVKIGSDVWIGDNVIVLSGVEIGNGCCIAAGSIITKSTPPYSIVAGIPARIIKYRFDFPIISFLEQIKWWNWSEKKIKINKDFFQQNLNDISLDKVTIYEV